jgi:AAA+ superfamily predicted ATPase
MTNHITIEPFSKNPMEDALNSPSYSNNNYVNNNHYNMYNLQNMVQMQILNTIMTNLNILTTGNPMFDMIIKTIIQGMTISIIGLLISQIGTFISGGKNLIFYFLSFLNKTITNIYYFIKHKINKEVKMIKRDVDIPYISDTRQINELYKAVFWYLTHNEEIDYLKEPYLQYVFDKKINLENRGKILENLNIHKILSQNKSKTIKYKNHEIKYTLTTEKITVYTDKDRTRENYKVLLSTNVSEIEQTDILEDFSQHCLTEYINNLTSYSWSQQIYTNDGTEWKHSPSNNSRKLETIILKKRLKEDIKQDLQLFLNSEEWYKDRDIPYTRGYLFYGYPGTGKTSMIKAISTYCKRHIHFLILSNVKSDAELFELLKKINYKDTILVIEDIDAMIDIVKSRDVEEIQDTYKKSNNRKKTNSSSNNNNNTNNTNTTKNKNNEDEKEKSNLTLSGILNAIDGVFTCNGRILIMTTNHPEVLDLALIRPGRIDSKYLFDNCNKDQIKGLYEMFFNTPANLDHIENIKNNQYSPAHITSVFLRYRNDPSSALLHLDDVETKIVITPLIKEKIEI